MKKNLQNFFLLLIAIGMLFIVFLVIFLNSFGKGSNVKTQNTTTLPTNLDVPLENVTYPEGN